MGVSSRYPGAPANLPSREQTMLRETMSPSSPQRSGRWKKAGRLPVEDWDEKHHHPANLKQMNHLLLRGWFSSSLCIFQGVLHNDHREHLLSWSTPLPTSWTLKHLPPLLSNLANGCQPLQAFHLSISRTRTCIQCSGQVLHEFSCLALGMDVTQQVASAAFFIWVCLKTSGPKIPSGSLQNCKNQPCLRDVGSVILGQPQLLIVSFPNKRWICG